MLNIPRNLLLQRGQATYLFGVRAFESLRTTMGPADSANSISYALGECCDIPE